MSRPGWRRILTMPGGCNRGATMAETLHARYDSVADEPVPKRLEIERLVRQPRRWMYGAIAATLVAFIAGGGAGWLAHGVAASPSVFQSFTGEALGAHRLYVVEVRHPVEVAGSERAHLQTLADQALRLGGVRAGAGRRRVEAGRRTAAARTHRTRLVPDV